MSSNSTSSRGNKTGKFIWGGIIVVLAVVVVFAITGLPPSEDDTRGAIGTAEKYQAEQISDEDILLKDPEFQAILQSDIFQELIQREDFQELLASQDFGAVAGDDDFGTLLNSMGPPFANVITDPVFATALEHAGPASYEVIGDDAMIGVMQNIGPASAEKIFTSQVFADAFNNNGEAIRDFVTSQDYKDLISHNSPGLGVVVSSVIFADLYESQGSNMSNVLAASGMVDVLKLKQLKELMLSKGPGVRVSEEEMSDFLRRNGYERLLKHDGAVGFLVDPALTRMYQSKEVESFINVVSDQSFKSLLDHNSRIANTVLSSFANIVQHAGPSASKMLVDPNMGVFLDRSLRALRMALKDPGFKTLMSYSADKQLLKHAGYPRLLKRNATFLRDLMKLKVWQDLMARTQIAKLMAFQGFPRLMRSAQFKTLAMRQNWDNLTFEK